MKHSAHVVKPKGAEKLTKNYISFLDVSMTLKNVLQFFSPSRSTWEITMPRKHEDGGQPVHCTRSNSAHQPEAALDLDHFSAVQLMWGRFVRLSPRFHDAYRHARTHRQEFFPVFAHLVAHVDDV